MHSTLDNDLLIQSRVWVIHLPSQEDTEDRQVAPSPSKSPLRLSVRQPSRNTRLRKLLSVQQDFSMSFTNVLFTWLPTPAHIELSPDELKSIEILRDEPTDEDDDWEMADGPFAHILEGRQPLNISHEGGEFEALEDLHSSMRKE